MSEENQCYYCGRRIQLEEDYHIMVYEFNANMLLSGLLFCDFGCLKRWVDEQNS